MSLHPRRSVVPADTRAAAAAIYRNKKRPNAYVVLRDRLGEVMSDQDFLSTYASGGRPATSPACLSLVTVLQYMEDLTDRQAAEAVRSRIDWKYLLGLSLEDEGFDFTVLHDFRERLLAQGQESMLFDRVLIRLTEEGLVRAGGRQRTDSTHVLGAISRLNRLELVGETMRATLNALATDAPAWLVAYADPSWVDRYGPRLVQQRLPQKERERTALEQQIGRDGVALLTAVDGVTTPTLVSCHPAVGILRRVWAQQYSEGDDGPHFRPTADLPPANQLICSPYDADARYSQKRDTVWQGYTAHLTETCEETQPHIITQITTTPALTQDVASVAAIQEDLITHGLAPTRHLVDTGYLSAAVVVTSQVERGITLVGPMRENVSWQAKAGAGYATAAFGIDWEAEHATCPQGKQSSSWRPVMTGPQIHEIQVHFRRADCQICAVRVHCTRADRRSITLHPHAEHEALAQARAGETVATFACEYAVRVGIEASIAQALARCGLRHARYRGLAKTHLQHLLTGTALNLIRVADWFGATPPRGDRRSSFVRLMTTTPVLP